VDLSPREVVEPAGRAAAGARRRWPALLVLVLVLAGGGLVVAKFLTSSIDYYCNVDEIGAKDGCEAGRRLRVQGTVEQGSVAQDGGVTSFRISFNDRTIPVRYEGDPGGIFQECVPVVVHGRLEQSSQGEVFAGDRVEVKHSNEYEAENRPGGRRVLSGVRAAVGMTRRMNGMTAMNGMPL
jgi:cytochrome c-type biogenesis protein CcmE